MKIILMISAILLMNSCSYINEQFGLKDDNIVEEVLEGYVEEKTGVDFDFTPFSPE